MKTPLVLEKETHDFASKMFPPGFFVVHDATRGSHNDITEIKIRKFEFLLEKFVKLTDFTEISALSFAITKTH